MNARESENYLAICSLFLCLFKCLCKIKFVFVVFWGAFRCFVVFLGKSTDKVKVTILKSDSRYIGGDFYLGPNLVSFNRAVVPLFELSFLTISQKLTSA
jgi:hypothetical protein